MNKIGLFIFSLFFSMPVFSQPSGQIPFNHGMKMPAEYEKLCDGFADPDMIYAPFMFWFWDEPLKTDKMVEMAETMIQQGINPGYVHPRRSMNESPSLPPEQWLGEAWFDAYQAVTQKTKEMDAYLGYVDEYWWPSLQAKGRVLGKHPDLKAWTLGTDMIRVNGGSKVDLPAADFTVAARVDSSGALLSSSLEVIGQGEALKWKAPKGSDWKVFVFTKIQQNTVNYMDTRLGDAFIDIALKPYEQHMGTELGKTIVADFVDNEGRYGHKLAWSDTLAARYRERYGRDIRLWMPLMLAYDREGMYAKARWEWFDLVSDIYVENFGKVVDWHTDRGMYCIPNFWEESLSVQTLYVGDHMKMQRKYTMPGQDALHSGVFYPHDFMEAVSVGEFENRRVMSEMMGAGQWNRFSPSILKKAINAVTAWGISNTSPHCVFTNRNLYDNQWMPDWYTENPLFQYLHLWSDFARRASYINSFGMKAAEVLLYTPLESVWVLTDSNHFDSRKEPYHLPWYYPENNENARKANVIDRAYAKAMNDLVGSRIDFLVADRHYIKEMDLSEGRLNYGDFSFKTLVLPPMVILELEVARKMLDFARQGGNVYVLGELPSASVENGDNDPEMIALMQALQEQPTHHLCRTEPMIVFAVFQNHWKGWDYDMDTDAYGLMPFIRLRSSGLLSPVQCIDGAFDLISQHRVIDGAHFFWLVNNTDKRQSPLLHFPGLMGKVSIWDCETGSIRSVQARQNGEALEIELDFYPMEAYWLVVDPEERLSFEMADIPGDPMQVIELKGPWSIRYLDENQPDLEPLWEIPAEFTREEGYATELKEWALIPELHERFTGFLDYFSSFEFEKTCEKVVIDLGRVYDMAEIWVNGAHAGKRLWAPYRFDIGSFLHNGTNTLRIRVGNQVDNYYSNPVPSGLLGPVMINTY
jgi:hypothetical protein